jgi:CDP-diacylglycerol pyrophosphatase
MLNASPSVPLSPRSSWGEVQSVEITDFLPALKRSRVPFSKRFIVPLIDSELHLAYEGQSGGTENHPHIFFSGPEIL